MRISDWSSDVCSSDLAVELEVLGHLGGQLARRRDDERARHSRAGSAARQDVDHGQSEAGGLAGAGLGAAEHVAAHQDNRYGFLLNRGGRGVTPLLNGPKALWTQSKKIGSASCRERVCQSV